VSAGSARRFRRRPDVLWRRSLDTVLILPAAADEVITLGATGVDIWELLDTWRTTDALTELLSARYDADPAVVRRDVAVLVEDLEGWGALELAAEGDGT
jgi:hypothetical protein